MQTIEEALNKLEKSRFRSGFSLSDADYEYLEAKGLDTIRRHAVDFVHQRLSPAYPEKDGRQTPMRGHPVFKAMHATACCCRGCLHKWYRVSPGRELTTAEEEKIVNLLMAWLDRQLARRAGKV